MTWHVHPQTLADYHRGALDTVRVLAVDTHLVRCPACRAAMPVDESWLTTSWEGVLDVVDAPRVGLLARVLARVGLPEHRVRLLAATPGLRRSWLAATAGVLTFAVASAQLIGDTPNGLLLVFLALAPVLPVLAVATAYGGAVDPMHEVTTTTPTAGPGLTLWRSSIVLAVSMGMAVLASLLLPGVGWYAVAWLLPAFLLSVGSLALSTSMSMQWAAGLLTGSWLFAVVAMALTEQGWRLYSPDAQVGYLVAALTALIVLVVRRRRLDPGEPR